MGKLSRKLGRRMKREKERASELKRVKLAKPVYAAIVVHGHQIRRGRIK